MKHLLIFLLLTTLLFHACNSDDDPRMPVCEACNFTCLDLSESEIFSNSCGANWVCSFKLNEQSQVDITDTRGFVDGIRNVFSMVNSTQGSLQATDDEITNTLVFDLGNIQSEFSSENEELAALNVHFKRVCFCAETNFKAVTSGCLQGEKQSNGNWFVQGDLTIPYSFGDIDVHIDAEFSN